MKMRKSLMNRKTVAYCLSTLILGGACLVSGLAVSTVFAAQDTGGKGAEVTSIKGTCTFGNKKSTWSAKLKPKGDGTYDAIYESSWDGKPLNYIGTIKTDLKKEISGNGKASGGSANGSFEFSGKYGDDGIAQCTYKEVGGNRNRKGAMTAEMPK
jgi:hypothetical protein